MFVTGHDRYHVSEATKLLMDEVMPFGFNPIIAVANVRTEVARSKTF